MIKSLSAALALALVLAAGSFAATPQSAAATPAQVSTALPDRNPPGAVYEWHAGNLRPWSGTHSYGIGTRGGAHQAYTAAAGSLAIRVEYPGVIQSAQVVGGPWRIEAQDSNSFTLTNTVALHTGTTNAASVQVSGQFAPTFVVPAYVRGDQNRVDIISSAHVIR